MRTLPKPARVEKWQRWRDSKGVEFTVTGPREDVIGVDIYPLRKDGEEGSWHGNNLLGWKNWTFLGYAKPDKVEVGQRWQHRAKGAMEIASINEGWATTVHGERFGIAFCKLAGWEYLGMSESADGTKMHVGVDVAHGPDMTVRSVVTRDQLRDMDERHLEGLREHGQRAGIPTVEQARKDARRANEEAAKRLIANPPGWAYQKAWMCAVLAWAEWCDANSVSVETGHGGLHEVCWYAHSRVAFKPHIDLYTGLVNAHDAYARGTERPTLLGRPGVKGGISTCDLGADYE